MSPDELERRKVSYIVQGIERDISNMLRNIKSQLDNAQQYHTDSFDNLLNNVIQYIVDIKGITKELRVIRPHLKPIMKHQTGKMRSPKSKDEIDKAFQDMVNEVIRKTKT